MSYFDDLMAEAVGGDDPESWAEVTVDVGKSTAVVRVRRITPAYEYNAITTKHPKRDGAHLDGLVNYNIHAAAREALPLCAVLVKDGEEVTLDAEQWDVFYDKLLAPSVEDVTDAVFTLNGWTPQMKVKLAKKVSAASQLTKPASPANSASPRAGSAGGSRRGSTKSVGTPKGASKG